jgi:hypothetical protein
MGLQHVGTKLGLANGAFWHEKPCRWKSAKPMLLPDCHQRIVARFCCEGKPDEAWKSRIINNLACTLRAGPAFISILGAPNRSLGCVLAGRARLSSLWNEPGL